MAADRAPAAGDEAAAAYTEIAGRYDMLEQEPVLAYMRSRSLRALKETMPRGGRLLELGCGTGAEAVEIAAALDATVVACDPSSGMLSRARARALGAGVSVEIIERPAGEALRELASKDERFDGAWASFSLSYDEPLAALRPFLAAVLRADAPFVCTLRNTFCIGEPWSIVSRAAGTYRHRVGGRKVALGHVSPRGAVRSLAPDFTLERSEALPAILPPPGLRRMLPAPRPGGEVESLDERVAGTWPWRSLGDHTLFRFRRVGGDAQ
jgi:SAM-dependent methyltransferase